MANLKEKKKNILTTALSNIKLHDAGVKEAGHCPIVSSSSEDRINYPNIYITAKQAPELKDYEVNDEVTMVVKGKITSHSIDESLHRSHESFSVDIKQIGIAPKK